MKTCFVWRQSVGSLLALSVAATALAGWFGYRAWAARRVTQEIDRLAQVLALEPTSRVADVGAGRGAYSLELASRIVPRGHVFATEVEEKSVTKIRASVSAAELDNVTVIRAGEASSNFAGLPSSISSHRGFSPRSSSAQDSRKPRRPRCSARRGRNRNATGRLKTG
jgi:hypothetical protein